MQQQIKTERLRRGWSQTRLSGLTGIAQSDISAVENGRRRAHAGWRRRLAAAFGVSEDELFQEQEPRQASRQHT
jgi:transcriptional regulator with XRE-family HTH domain